ncbi:hypothetical protein AVEN_113099-1 [Araneus ventricosus]|uniref:Uncharacterized protein n=1 Tax=Araneus ventricosus TaxID=182803 RepID=A0A4Y2X4N1_ARAVE|nr:hypothetical protein AVEN_113099-1 [Araneus ventricosus]
MLFFDERINDDNHFKTECGHYSLCYTDVLTHMWEELDYHLHMCVGQKMEPSCAEQVQPCKPGGFSFYLVKMPPVYLVSLLFCDRSRSTP